MSSFEIDVSELNAVAAVFDTKAKTVLVDARAVVERGALNVKEGARAAISGLAHAPLYPLSIGYDVINARIFGSVEAEIGPDKSKPQGALGNILEYGTTKNAPFAHLGPALDREGPNFADALADVAGEVFP